MLHIRYKYQVIKPLSEVLVELTRTVADNYVVYEGSVTKLSSELLLCSLYKLIVQLILNEVDGAATEATTHHTATCNAALLSEFSEEVELYAAYFVVLTHTPVCLVHLSTYGLVVTLLDP